MIATASKATETTYNVAIGFALIELMRIRMQRLAMEDESPLRPRRLLATASRSVVTEIENLMRQRQVAFDLRIYVRQAEKQLKPASRELEKLSGSLKRSRTQGKVGAEEFHEAAVRLPCEVRRLGLADKPDGLLLLPRQATSEIDIDNIKRIPDCQVLGDWFPFEVYCGDFLFVVDDDGSVFVSIENLPERISIEVQRYAETIALALLGAPIPQQRM